MIVIGVSENNRLVFVNFNVRNANYAMCITYTIGRVAYSRFLFPRLAQRFFIVTLPSGHFSFALNIVQDNFKGFKFLNINYYIEKTFIRSYSLMLLFSSKLTRGQKTH
jgi:hypothetical protein